MCRLNWRGDALTIVSDADKEITAAPVAAIPKRQGSIVENLLKLPHRNSVPGDLLQILIIKIEHEDRWHSKRLPLH